LTQVNRVININGLKAMNVKMQNRLDNLIGRFLSKYVLSSNGSNIFFPLHNRHLTNSLNYSEMFHDIKLAKICFDSVKSKKLKIPVQLEIDHMLEQGPINQDEFLAFYESRVQTKMPSKQTKDNSVKLPLEAQNSDPIPEERKESEIITLDYKGVHWLPCWRKPVLPRFNSSSFHSPSADSMMQVNINEGHVNFADLLERRKGTKSTDQNNNTGLFAEKDGELGRASRTQKASMMIALKCIDDGSGFISDILNKSRSLLKQPSTIKNKNIRRASRHINQIVGSMDDLDKEEHNMLDIKEEYLSEVMSLYKLNNSELIDSTLDMLYSSRYLRDGLPTLFKNQKDISNFKDIHEKQLKFPLNVTFKLRKFLSLRFLPEKSIQYYFGEKITLFLSFGCAYQDWLVPVSIWGMVEVVLSLIYNSDPKYETEGGLMEFLSKSSTILLCIFVSIWSAYFLEKWKYFEEQFSQRYGQNSV